MAIRVASVVIAAFPLVLSACAGHPTLSPFAVVVRGPASSCTIEVTGRRVTADELLLIARPEVTASRRAHVDGNMADTPYKCFGEVIYTLQRAGFKNVGFVAKPPSKQH